MLKPARPSFSVEEYLWQEQRAAFKSEYEDGLIYAAARNNNDHSQIQSNLIAALGQALRGSDCRVLTSDVKVGVDTLKNYVTWQERGHFVTYPDASVLLGQPEYYKDDPFTIANPLVLFEVVGPATRNYDHVTRRRHYCNIPSLTSYVMISAEWVEVEVYLRTAPTSWLIPDPLESRQDILKLPAINVEIPLSSLYDRIEFEEDENE